MIKNSTTVWITFNGPNSKMKERNLRERAILGFFRKGLSSSSLSLPPSEHLKKSKVKKPRFQISETNPVLRKSMATIQFNGSSIGTRWLPSVEGLRPSMFKSSSVVDSSGGGLRHRKFQGLVVKAANVVPPKYTAVKPVGDRVLLKIKIAEDKTPGGIILPTAAQQKSQGGEVVAVGDGKTIGTTKVDIDVKVGSQVVYSKYAGTELEFNGLAHNLLKEDDIVGILETDDIKDLKPLSDRVLIKVSEAEEKTEGGLVLTNPNREKPSIGTVIAVGPGYLDPEGNKKPLTITPGSTVLYSKYSGSEFKGSDGDYLVLRASDVMAVLPS